MPLIIETTPHHKTKSSSSTHAAVEILCCTNTYMLITKTDYAGLGYNINLDTMCQNNSNNDDGNNDENGYRAHHKTLKKAQSGGANGEHQNGFCTTALKIYHRDV